MPNFCSYTAKIAGRQKSDVARFLAILNYKDYGLKGSNGVSLSRTFYAKSEKCPGFKDGFWTADVVGDVAWSLKTCWTADGYFGDSSHKFPNGEPLHYVFKSEGQVCYQNLVATVPQVCQMLRCGIEAWSEEPGMCFQEHLVCNARGQCTLACRNWVPPYHDDETDRDVAGSGGFVNYLEFMTPDGIANAEAYDDDEA